MSVSPASPLKDDLARLVAATLANAHSDALARTLALRSRDPRHYEASVRGHPGEAPIAGRMMIEQASPEVFDAIAHALDIPLPPVIPHWLALARQEGVPLIAGWDLRGGGAQRCAKLYVNASDASHAARMRLADALAPCAANGHGPAAVLGMNVRADGVTETKVYVQSADAVAAMDVAGRARDLALAARDEGADAGCVVSFDATNGALRPRAFFVALREPRDGTGWQCVRSLPGYDPHAIASLLPFAPAPPRSLGISLADGAWTLYFKPRNSGRAPDAIEPAEIFSVGDAEVALFIEPTEHAVRAFCLTDRHAVSVRVRHGTPSPEALESLVDWYAARLRVAERAGTYIQTLLSDPPDPWRRIPSPHSTVIRPAEGNAPPPLCETPRPRPLVRTTPETRFFDYCLQPYDPLRDPRGKLRSESLLWNSLDVAGATPALDDMLRTIQHTAGLDMTVVGIKHQEGRLWWELYFYDRLKEDPAVRAASIAEVVAPWSRILPRPRETVPYFMFSFDIHPGTVEGGTVEVLNLYLPYYEVQGGRSYKLFADRLEMDNVYRFLHPKTEIREILHEIRQSVFVDFTRVPLSRILLPELIDCNRICVAKKRFADAVYYSGIDVGQLLTFLRVMNYPPPITAFVETHRSLLDHLRFDVGIDYTMRPDGSLLMTKSSYYCTL